MIKQEDISRAIDLGDAFDNNISALLLGFSFSVLCFSFEIIYNWIKKSNERKRRKLFNNSKIILKIKTKTLKSHPRINIV